MVSLTIDGQSVKAKEGSTILEAALSANIYIPTLCSHPLLEPFGACRLCIVEISDGRRSGMVTSCAYPAEEGLGVKTHSPDVLEARKMLIELLLARAPKAIVVQRLAQEYGVEKTQLKVKDEGELCILCGLCARICDEIIGASAINFVGRGVTREVIFNPVIAPELCVGCGACTAICPSGCLELEKPYGVIAAIAMGRKAAISMDKYLGGEGIIDEKLVEAESPNPWLGMEEGFVDWRREKPILSDGLTKEQAIQEAKRCLRCNLRLEISPPILPPRKCLRLEESQVCSVPETEGAIQLLDEGRNTLYIKGTANMRKELEEQLNTNDKARYFLYEEAPMYTSRESELLQQFLQQHGKLPPQNADLDDLFD